MARNVTIKLLEIMDNNPRFTDLVARACLSYMSESEVADMAESEGLLEEEDFEEDEEEDDEE